MKREDQPSPGSAENRLPAVTRRVVIAAGFATIAGIAAGSKPGIAAAAASVPDPRMPPLRGTWRKQHRDGANQVQLSFRFAEKSAEKSIDGSTFAIRTGTASESDGPTFGKTGIRIPSVRLQQDAENRPWFARDAGTFTLLDFDGQRVAGDVLFSADAGFVDQLGARGISLNDRELMELGLSGATVRDVTLTTSAFQDADIPTIAYVAIFQAADNVVPLKHLLPTMTARDLHDFIVFGITPSYVGDLREAGLSELAPSDVTELKIAGVDGAFVRGRTVDGVAPSVPDLLQAKSAARGETG